MHNSLEKIKFTISVKIKLADKTKQPDLLAYASVRFQDDQERYFNISGLTIRKHKFGDDKKYWIAYPKTRIFEFLAIHEYLKAEIERIIIEKYEYHLIPVIN